jgi:hypothetical protein
VGENGASSRNGAQLDEEVTTSGDHLLVLEDGENWFTIKTNGVGFYSLTTKEFVIGAQKGAPENRRGVFVIWMEQFDIKGISTNVNNRGTIRGRRSGLEFRGKPVGDTHRKAGVAVAQGGGGKNPGVFLINQTASHVVLESIKEDKGGTKTNSPDTDVNSYHKLETIMLSQIFFFPRGIWHSGGREGKIILIGCVRTEPILARGSHSTGGVTSAPSRTLHGHGEKEPQVNSTQSRL